MVQQEFLSVACAIFVPGQQINKEGDIFGVAATFALCVAELFVKTCKCDIPRGLMSQAGLEQAESMCSGASIFEQGTDDLSCVEVDLSQPEH